MRICIVYDCLYPHTIGGAERWYRSLAERTAAAGHEVTYLTLRQWDRDSPPDLAGVRVVAVGPRMALYTEDGRRRILPPLVFGLGVLWHLLRHPRRYEVLDTCAFPYFSLLAAALARPLGGYALAVDWFEVWSDSYWRSYLGALGGRVGGLVQRLCARVPQRARCFSQLHARRLRDEGLRGPILVLRGLLDNAPPATEPLPAEPLVLFAGRLIPEKQAPLAAAAIGRAAALIEDLHGLMLGEGPERAKLDAEIARSACPIEAPGFEPVEVIERAMSHALCLLVTSSREGYGLVVVEAAARGTPSVVLAGPDNAATELIEEGVNGFVVGEADAQALARAIAAVHEAGGELRRSTAAWFADHAQELSLQGTLDAILADYASARS